MAIVSAATLPHIFHQLKWYHIAAFYVFATVLALCNAYGCGLTHWTLASTYGKMFMVQFNVGADAERAKTPCCWSLGLRLGFQPYLHLYIIILYIVKKAKMLSSRK
ncbi:hypothetical protein CTI12_AA494810 [Artemisia annua]|uniref:Uncharacterized protein n=1 Tax=Artemisia annua TaxID=35608 RepID=A0A2U1LER3_ARTAN|nr:hypothetical protein CTI12_AA494810 [Artemisia annua]